MDRSKECKQNNLNDSWNDNVDCRFTQNHIGNDIYYERGKKQAKNKDLKMLWIYQGQIGIEFY